MEKKVRSVKEILESDEFIVSPDFAILKALIDKVINQLEKEGNLTTEIKTKLNEYWEYCDAVLSNPKIDTDKFDEIRVYTANLL